MDNFMFSSKEVPLENIETKANTTVPNTQRKITPSMRRPNKPVPELKELPSMHHRNKPAPRSNVTQELPITCPDPEPQIIQQIPASLPTPELRVNPSMRRPIKPALESRIPLPVRRPIKPDPDAQVRPSMCRPFRSTRRPIPPRSSLIQAFQQVLARQNDAEYITLSSDDEDDKS
jgi:hypothetical protein